MGHNASRMDKPVALLWSCELTEQNKSFSFKVEVEECEQKQALKARPGSISTGKSYHRLVLNAVSVYFVEEHACLLLQVFSSAYFTPAIVHVCMGEKAKDELHIIEILPKEDEQGAKPVPIASLKPSILPMATLVGWELTPPVTFRLKSGSGPVYISGQHIASEEEAEEEAEVSPVKPNNRQATQENLPLSLSSLPLKRKMDEEDEEEEMESEEDTKKGKPAAKGRKPAAKK
ncbi:nucleoplasmin-like [Lissotriton helveticus]